MLCLVLREWFHLNLFLPLLLVKKTYTPYFNYLNILLPNWLCNTVDLIICTLNNPIASGAYPWSNNFNQSSSIIVIGYMKVYREVWCKNIHSNISQNPFFFQDIKHFKRTCECAVVKVIRGIFTLMLVLANLANTKWCKKPWKWLKPWNMGTRLRVLSGSYPMKTILWVSSTHTSCK